MRRVGWLLAVGVFILCAGPAIAAEDVVQWATEAIASSEYQLGCQNQCVWMIGERDCRCPDAAIGPPNADPIQCSWCGLCPWNTHWFPDWWQAEWLELTFDPPVYASSVEIFGLAPGGAYFIDAIEIVDIFGNTLLDAGRTAADGCNEVIASASFAATGELVDTVRVWTPDPPDDGVAPWIDTVRLSGDDELGAFRELWPIAATASISVSDFYMPYQAIGEPDQTGVCGFSGADGRAWTPDDDGEDPEWLEVRFDQPVHATGMAVYQAEYGEEAAGLGIVTRIELIDPDSNYHSAWEGTDISSCPGVLELTFPETLYLVVGARIHTQAPGWEAIDAVRLDSLSPASAASAVKELLEEVAALGLEGGIAQSLTSKLETALSKLAEATASAALEEQSVEQAGMVSVNLLQAFINAVEAQRGKKLTEQVADELISAAEAIIAQIEGG